MPITRSPPGRRRKKRARISSCCATRTAAVCRSEIAAITKVAVGKLNCKVGIHTHDDIGLGVANALAALEAGAVHVQGTINGYGERTGNCNLTSVIPCVALKMKKTCVPAKSLAKLKELSMFVDEVANMRHNPRLPWVGSAAFAHKGGAHVNAVQKLASSYEHIDPSLVGNQRNILISDLAGRSNIVIKAQELGFKLTNDTPELKPILNRVKELETKATNTRPPKVRWRCSSARRSINSRNCRSAWKISRLHAPRREAIRLRSDRPRARRQKRVRTTVAEGDGPVNALDRAALPRWRNFSRS
jgi:2-isopropylmalate synthase